MKLYECIFVYDSSFVKVGTKFVLYKGFLYPHKSTNMCGLELKFLGLNNEKKFNKHFKFISDVKPDSVPFIRNCIKTVKLEIKDVELALSELKKELKGLESL